MVLYHFPGCPYSERVEILLCLKGLAGKVDDVQIDISAPRPDWLLKKTGGSTALPVLDCGQQVLRESAVIVRYLDASLPGPGIAHADPMQHAIESLFAQMDSGFARAGYAFLRNQDRELREALKADFDSEVARYNTYLRTFGGEGPFLQDDFGWAEVMLTPILKRLECLAYYESYKIPDEFERYRQWRAACLDHPATQGRSLEEIVKLYYDYSRDAGGGKLVAGRTRSSFTMDPPWQGRPMPPRDKWQGGATDRELGLID